MPRDEFIAKHKRLLAERVGFHCSNPSCGVATIGPATDPSKIEYVGVAAHIYSASENGPRANPVLTEEKRRSPENGIHLCSKCSTLIDKNNGDGYSPETLFSWKRSAEADAKARVYSNNSYVQFRAVDFTNLEENYSTALTCSSLSAKNVISCPANEQVISEISKKLLLANKCVLRGCSGSGKSILTYQTAYEFCKNGWSIFCFNKESISENTKLASPQDKSVVLIDNAQTISFQDLENILHSAHCNLLILANWNTSTVLDREFLKTFPCVDVIPSVQVKLLETFCLENKKDISSLLKKNGTKVSSKGYHTRIEARIERAAREKTPWLFNYYLTEGWNSAENDLMVLKDAGQLNLVVLTVAIYQFATLDHGVKKDIVISALQHFRSDPLWISKVEHALKEYCQTEDGLIKNRHYEYSRKILRSFAAGQKSEKEVSCLITILKQILLSPDYEKGHSNILELILFDFRWCHQELAKTGFFEKLTRDLFADKDDMNSLQTKFAKLNSLIRANKNTLQILEDNSGTFEKWIFNCGRDSAYSLGNLLNTLNNEKYSHFPSSKALIDSLIDKTISSDLKDKSRFSYMLDRANMLFSDEEMSYAKERLAGSNFSVDVLRYSEAAACYHFSSLIKNLSYVSPDWANEQIKNNINGIASLLNYSFMSAYQDFRGLIDHYFGVTHAILRIKIRDPELAKRGRELAKKLTVDSILKGFEAVDVVDVQGYASILIFMGLYNKSKLKGKDLLM